MKRLLTAAVRDESGIALIMALGILFVLTITLTTVIVFSNSNGRDATYDNGGQNALALAEGGLNNAFAQLATHYPNATTAGSAAWVGSVAQPYSGGTAAWSGTFDGSASTWTLTGTGTTPNPNGGTAITRTATANVDVKSSPGSSAYGYGFFLGDATAACTTISGSPTLQESFYDASCMTMSGAATIREPVAAPSPPTVQVYVGGRLDLEGSAGIGTSTSPILSATVTGGCVFRGATSTCSNGNSSSLYAKSYSTTPVAATLPTVDTTAIYKLANWSSATCASGSNPFDNNATRDNSRGTVRLLASPTFDCSASNSSAQVVGRLAWNLASHLLTVSGTVFIDGDLTVSNNDIALYSGNGTVYLNGTVSFINSGSICGPGAGAVATFPCNGRWDPTAGELLLVACNSANASTAFSVADAGAFEGASFAVGTYSAGNGVLVKGPVLATRADLSGAASFPPLATVPVGAPGASSGYALGAPYGYR